MGNSPKIHRRHYEGGRSRGLLSQRDFPLTSEILMVRIRRLMADPHVDRRPSGKSRLSKSAGSGNGDRNPETKGHEEIGAPFRLASRC